MSHSFDALPKFGKTQLISQFCPLLSVRFNSFLSKFLWILSSYSIVKFHVPSSSSVSLHHRVFYARLGSTSLDFGAAHCAVVGLDGLEPSTSRLSGARSSHLSYRPVFLSGYLVRPSLTTAGIEPLTRQGRVVRFLAPFVDTIFQAWTACGSALKNGGDEGNRTLDPLLAGQVLSQLSYTPILLGLFFSGLFLSNPDNWTTKNFHTTEYTSAWVFCPNLTTRSQVRLAHLASRSP